MAEVGEVGCGVMHAPDIIAVVNVDTHSPVFHLADHPRHDRVATAALADTDDTGAATVKVGLDLVDRS